MPCTHIFYCVCMFVSEFFSMWHLEEKGRLLTSLCLTLKLRTPRMPFAQHNLPSRPRLHATFHPPHLIRFSCVCVLMYVFMCVCVCVCMCVRVWKGEAKKMCNSIYSTACLVPRLAPYLHRSLPPPPRNRAPLPFSAGRTSSELKAS